MSDYAVYVLSVCLRLVIGLAAYLFTRKWQARKIAAAREGAMLRTLVDNLPDCLREGYQWPFSPGQCRGGAHHGRKGAERLLGKNDSISIPRNLRLAITRTSRR